MVRFLISHLVTGSVSYQKIVIFCGHGQISDLPLSDRECFLPKNSNFLRAPLFSIPTKYCSSVTRELFRCTQVWTLTLLRARRAVCACSRWCRQDLIHGVVTVTALVWQARALTQCHSTLGITPPHVILVWRDLLNEKTHAWHDYEEHGVVCPSAVGYGM
jgi:hypothetical protein